MLKLRAIIFGVRWFHKYLYGRTFTQVTDHHPLCKILGEKEGILPLAAARMQRWALLLSVYSYSIQHIPGKLNYCADCMSRLPSPTGSRDKAEKVHAMVETPDTSPVLATQIAKASVKDKTIATVITTVHHGHWPRKIEKSLSLYYNRRNDLSVVDGCLLWGRRVIIPPIFCKQLLKNSTV